jgi:hypothetical protein
MGVSWKTVLQIILFTFFYANCFRVCVLSFSAFQHVLLLFAVLWTAQPIWRYGAGLSMPELLSAMTRQHSDLMSYSILTVRSQAILRHRSQRAGIFPPLFFHNLSVAFILLALPATPSSFAAGFVSEPFYFLIFIT